MGHVKSLCSSSIRSSLVREFLAEYLGGQSTADLTTLSHIQQRFLNIFKSTSVDMRLTVRDLPAGGVRVRLHGPVRPLPPPPRQRPDCELGPGRGRGARHDGGRGRVGRPPQPRPHNSRGQPRQVPLGQGEADRQLSSAVTPPRPGRCLTTWRRSTWGH